MRAFEKNKKSITFNRRLLLVLALTFPSFCLMMAVFAGGSLMPFLSLGLIAGLLMLSLYLASRRSDINGRILLDDTGFVAEDISDEHVTWENIDEASLIEIPIGRGGKQSLIVLKITQRPIPHRAHKLLAASFGGNAEIDVSDYLDRPEAILEAFKAEIQRHKSQFGT